MADSEAAQQPGSSSASATTGTFSASAQEPPPRRGVQTRQRLLSETRTTNGRTSRSRSSGEDNSSGGSDGEIDAPPTAKRARVTGARTTKAKAGAKGKTDDDKEVDKK